MYGEGFFFFLVSSNLEKTRLLRDLCSIQAGLSLPLKLCK